MSDGLTEVQENKDRISDEELFGVLGHFPDPPTLIAATQKAYDAGYREMEAYSPFPVHGLADALGFKKTWMPQVVLIGGIIGCILGYGMQYYLTVIEYPVNIGGRPLHSWPSFIPVTFETTVLGAALSAVLGMLALNRLPRPYHPLFHIQKFSSASRDGFFLLLLSRDKQFDPDEARKFMTDLQPTEMFDVPR